MDFARLHGKISFCGATQDIVLRSLLTWAENRLPRALKIRRDGYRRVERVAGRFFRRFTPPDTANAEGITAKSTHGVLEVIIPEHDRVMPRRISVDVN